MYRTWVPGKRAENADEHQQILRVNFYQFARLDVKHKTIRIISQLLACEWICPPNTKVFLHTARNVAEIAKLQLIDSFRTVRHPLIEDACDAVLGEYRSATVGMVNDSKFFEVHERVKSEDTRNLWFDTATDGTDGKGFPRCNAEELIRLTAWIRTSHDQDSSRGGASRDPFRDGWQWSMCGSIGAVALKKLLEAWRRHGAVVSNVCASSSVAL